MTRPWRQVSLFALNRIMSRPSPSYYFDKFGDCLRLLEHGHPGSIKALCRAVPIETTSDPITFISNLYNRVHPISHVPELPPPPNDGSYMRALFKRIGHDYESAPPPNDGSYMRALSKRIEHEAKSRPPYVAPQAASRPSFDYYKNKYEHCLRVLEFKYPGRLEMLCVCASIEKTSSIDELIKRLYERRDPSTFAPVLPAPPDDVPYMRSLFKLINCDYEFNSIFNEMERDDLASPPEVEDKDCCVICLEKEKKWIIFECGHVLLCDLCLEMCFGASKTEELSKCPICNNEGELIKKIRPYY